jgi:hypothetical protein
LLAIKAVIRTQAKIVVGDAVGRILAPIFPDFN